MTAPRGRRRATGDERGVALALALWLVVVLTAVALAVASAARMETQVTENLRARAVARWAAESGIHAGRARIEALLAASATPAERVLLFRDLDDRLADLAPGSVGTGSFAVTVQDLNALLDVNRASPDALFRLFVQFADERRARHAADGVSDWIDGDSLVRPAGAEADAYAASGSPYEPPNAPLRHVEELARVAGVGPDLSGAITPFVTVHGDGLIDANAAPERVLLAAAGPVVARTVVARRSAGEVFTSVGALLAALQSGARDGNLPLWGAGMSGFTVAPTRLEVTSRGWESGHSLAYEIRAVFVVTGSRLVLDAWEERDP